MHEVDEKRGRPKVHHDDEPRRKYVQRYTGPNGSSSVWIYDLDVNPYGPVSTEEFPPTEVEEEPEEKKVVIPTDQAELPKTQRKYINPANGKEVGYTRAKNLGLI
jgi:hypothetical protein